MFLELTHWTLTICVTCYGKHDIYGWFERCIHQSYWPQGDEDIFSNTCFFSKISYRMIYTDIYTHTHTHIYIYIYTFWMCQKDISLDNSFRQAIHTTNIDRVLWRHMTTPAISQLNVRWNQHSVTKWYDNLTIRLKNQLNIVALVLTPPPPTPPLVPHICVSELGHHCFRKWLVAF